ncbi:MAG: hypothetical protein GY757_07320, partial [bacterium]|nr:hypothetical protein [bacterium]
MKDFFHVQMEELARLNPDVVESGLALDLLMFHTTEMGTAKFRELEEIRTAYGKRHDVLKELLKMEKNVYLLTDTDTHDPDRQTKTKGTSLAHDTLAPVVINEYNESDRPGQRAGRILAAKSGDFERAKEKVWLDESDLEIVEQGREGMKSLSDSEEELLRISRKHKEQREKEIAAREKEIADGNKEIEARKK